MNRSAVGRRPRHYAGFGGYLKVGKALTLLGLCWAAPLVAGAASVPAELGIRLVQNYVAPSMQTFHRSATQMHNVISAYCANPSAQSRGDVRSAFAHLTQSWSKIEFLRFGPLVASNRFERIYFWPDPRGITVRQVNKLLNGSTESLNAKTLAEQSVAAQGLTALEYLLYREGGLLAASEEAATPGPSESRPCRYAMALAENLSVESGVLAAAWDTEKGGYAMQFYLASGDHAIYRSAQEIAAEAIKSTSSGLQFVRDVKLAPMLGPDASHVNLKRGPFWRSELGEPAMAANVEGMFDFYAAAGWGYAPDERWIDDQVRRELKQALAALSTEDGVDETRLKTSERLRQLRLSMLVLDNAKSLIDSQMAPALGIRIGFNALDGD